MNILTAGHFCIPHPTGGTVRGEEQKEENGNASLGRHEAKCFQTIANIVLASFLQAESN